MKKIFFLFSLIFVSTFCFDKDKNFQVVQNTKDSDEVYLISQIFEQALVDFFFDAGHIVSTSPIFVKKDEGADKIELKKVLIDSTLGSMMYLIRVELLFEGENSKNPNNLDFTSIKKVLWNVYRVDNGKLLSSSSVIPDKTIEYKKTEAEIYNFASFVAAKISLGLTN